MLASVIGLRANATAIDVPSSSVGRVLGGEQQRQERVVAGLGRPAAGVAGLLELGRLGAGLGDDVGDASVDLHGRDVE